MLALSNRNAFGVVTAWRHSPLPDFLGDGIGVDILLWTKRGRPVEPETASEGR